MTTQKWKRLCENHCGTYIFNKAKNAKYCKKCARRRRLDQQNERNKIWRKNHGAVSNN